MSPMSMSSAVYVGWVRHRRHTPVRHAFKFPLFMMYLDLGELPGLFARRWLWSAHRPALAWFRRRDYLGDPAIPLDEAVRDLVAARLGFRPNGPVRMLTHMRYLGYGFNPITLYYCFDVDGDRLRAVVGEVTNTPWGERHSYVIPAPSDSGRITDWRLRKAHHVSPFMDLEMEYGFTLAPPGRRLAVHIVNRRGSERLFDATLILSRRSVSSRNLALALLRYPAMTAQVIVAIYWQALRIWLKGVPYVPRPKEKETRTVRAI